ncbi:transporter ExbB [Aliidongia dinghuensis]|uniref:Transporter ExbB n=2 Tax=Aliidongia dinghuensis TaxID=1867774 RepID=A0A8J2YZS4_9PROT|nr:transporter ExbB [Aliidongia dinghuensis]
MLLGLCAGLTLRPGAAYAWWNDDWSLRKKITIDTSATGAGINDPIGTTPVLLRLHVGNFKFDAANQDGSDLRIVAGDDKTPLKFHIEKYDGLLGEAFVWVSVPDLKPGAKTDLWLYYGNKKAADGQDTKGTYDADTVLVYHFGEHGSPAHDFSAWGNNAQSAGLPSDGSLIGPGLRLDGQTNVTLPASASLTWADGAAETWSAWLNETALQANATLFSRRDGANALRIGVDGGVPFVEVSTAGGTQRTGAGSPIAAGTWHHLAVVTGSQIALYLDGKPYATLNAPLPALASAALLGADAAAAQAAPAAAPAATAPAADAQTAAPAPAAPSAGFAGELDELEISKVARPVGYIKVAAVGQGGDASAKFLTIGGDEETASWLSGYLAVILRSVTLDGWVVIGILAIMAVISWIVMADKAAYVSRVAKGNTLFLDRFRHVAADLTILDNDDVTRMGGLISQADLRSMRHSSLYRIYHIGAGEIRHRFAGQAEQQAKVLSGPSIAAIRAALDTGLVRETQQLNRLMVILTIAISGGPFLGLLGTVVGVMITFAAIAQSGDVNVNAIAPGIAAALVATVAGLAVAIPALFGYNYLISRIKDSTSDMQVFVDEFVTKMAEFYRGHSGQQTIAAE